MTAVRGLTAEILTRMEASADAKQPVAGKPVQDANISDGVIS